MLEYGTLLFCTLYSSKVFFFSGLTANKTFSVGKRLCLTDLFLYINIFPSLFFFFSWLAVGIRETISGSLVEKNCLR